MQQYDAAAPTDPLAGRPQLASQLRALLADDWQPAAAVGAIEAPVEEIEERPAGGRPDTRSPVHPLTLSQPAEPDVLETGSSAAVPEKITVDQTPLEIPLGDDEPQLTYAADTSALAADEQTHGAVPARVEVVPGLGKVYEATPEDDYGAPRVPIRKGSPAPRRMYPVLKACFPCRVNLAQ